MSIPVKHLSTREAAKFTGLGWNTVIRAFDRGDLKGFKVPGSRFRRIPVPSLRAWMVAHKIPTEAIDREFPDQPALAIAETRSFKTAAEAESYLASLVTPPPSPGPAAA